jgi:hypothetical protein
MAPPESGQRMPALTDSKLAEPPSPIRRHQAQPLASDAAPPGQPPASHAGLPAQARPQGGAVAKTVFNFRKSPKKKFRGTPPPSTIDLSQLPNTTMLTEHEVAAILRRSKSVLEYWRKVKSHPLKWHRVAGRILYELPSVRELLKGGETGDS